MYCRKCGNKIDDDSKFCPHCGEEIIKSPERNNNAKDTRIRCPVCNYEIGEEEKKCPNCNADLRTFEERSKDIKMDDKEEKKSNTTLKIIEVILWVGAGLVLLNLFLDEIDWFLIVSAEILIFSGIAYIREWIKNFEVPLVLMILGLINNIVALSIIDILLYATGIYGLVLKKKELNE